MLKRKSIEFAEQYEAEARTELLKRRRGGISSYEKMINAYKKAGNLRRDAGDLIGAVENYRKVLLYTNNPEIKKNIQEKIDDVLLQRKKTLSFLKVLKNGLEQKFVFAFFSIISLVLALFFTSFNLTGNAILGLTENNSSWIGLCLFIGGLIFTFLYFRKK